MTDEKTTVLYALSTLAQTCAALAAFVGAVGVFRLQGLRERYAALEREMRGWGEWLTGQTCHSFPLADVLARIEMAEEQPARDRAQYIRPVQEARRNWQAFVQNGLRARPDAGRARDLGRVWCHVGASCPRRLAHAGPARV